MRRCEDNIRMDLKQIVINARNLVNSAQYMEYWRALVNVALDLHKPWSLLFQTPRFNDWGNSILNFKTHTS